MGPSGLLRDLFEGWEESDEIEIRLLFQWWAHKNSNLGPLINSPNYDFDLALPQSGKIWSFLINRLDAISQPNMTTKNRKASILKRDPMPSDCAKLLNIAALRANNEACPMWLDIQPWLPLLTIGLTITICFGIVSLMKGLSHSKS